MRLIRSRRSRWMRVMATPLVIGMALSVVAASPVSASDAVTNGCVQSVPDPGTAEPVSICYTVFRPDEASARAPVPLIFHGHGWGGSRSVDPADFADFLADGFGVLSFDQRGFGDSGGKAQLVNPDIEGQDVQRLVDLVTGLEWVAKETPDDPVLGAIGGSYGGGYQFVGAFSELRDREETRFDVLAPEITWYSLAESLAPQGVTRTQWGLVLYAAGLPSDAHTTTVTRGFLDSTATGNFPDYLREFVSRNGPAWHVGQGRKLDIPVLFRQGVTDNLFPLDQGLKNFQRALTDKARAQSIFVGYNGGHALPSVVPSGSAGAVEALRGAAVAADPCSAEIGGGSYRQLTLRFFAEELLREKTGLGGHGQYHVATAGGRCVTVDSTQADTVVPLGDVINTAGVGAPLSYPITRGPLTIAGTPTLEADVTSLTADGRLFLALAVGENALDAKIVQNNMLPLREPGITINKPRAGVELPSVAVDVPAGQTLFLTVSPISDMSFGHGSRVPGAMTLKNVSVHLPVVE
jgi:ABC-2 type transport system ATP-binding protein